MVFKVPGTGQRNRTGASSGADFGFWHLSVREERRCLGRFPDRRRFMGAKSSQLSERPMARAFLRCRPLRRDSCLFRRNDGDAGDAERMPRRSCRSSRPACLANVRASLRLCRWLLSVASGLASPSTAWERGSRRERAATTRPQAGIGRGLAWACCVRSKFSPHPAYCGWYTRVRVLACDSKHRAASAGPFAPAGEPASRGSLRAVHMGCGCAAAAAA